MPEPDIQELLRLYRFMLMSRRMDEMERQATNRGLAHFHVSGMGHEASAALAFALGEQDWLHCHYRDKALMLARGLTPLDFFLALLYKKGSSSLGRQMNAFMASRSYKILSIVGPVGNNALQSVGVAAAVSSEADAPIVLASMGDGTTQQGEVLEAIAEAACSRLPVLFLIHDNGLAISTRTKNRTFFSLPGNKLPDDFMGVRITRVDGANAEDCLTAFKTIVQAMRTTRLPEIVIFECQRLDGHSNADDHSTYRSSNEIEQSVLGDPVAVIQKQLLSLGVPGNTLEALDQEVSDLVHRHFDAAMRSPEPDTCTDIPGALKIFASDLKPLPVESRLTMVDAIRNSLRDSMAADSRVILYGQDIEDPKGDVFGVTRGLSTKFPEQVLNSPLTESTIVGVSIGRALVGQRPVAMMQFADFLPNAWNQISQEMATIAWRTDGQFTAPVVVMAVCGGYKGGLGPFHSQTNDSMAAHMPGLDVMVPSNPMDASMLLKAALNSERPTVFLYPKALLNERSGWCSAEIASDVLPPGRARIVQRGTQLTIVTWGGAAAPCFDAVIHASHAGYSIELIDLRTLAPWDKTTVIESVRRTRRLLVVHEDNLTGGFGAEIIASAVEQIEGEIECLRVTRPDTHIPCNFPNHLEILPSASRILAGIAQLLDIEYAEVIAADIAVIDPHIWVVNTFGMSPSDDQVKVLRWFVSEGDAIIAGQPIAEVDSDKASGEVAAPAEGVIAKLLAGVGDTVRVGQPLFHIRTKEIVIAQPTDKPLPRLVRKTSLVATSNKISPVSTAAALTAGYNPIVPRVKVYLPTAALGTGTITNATIAEQFANTDASGIFEKTGIESRPQITPEETPTSLVWKAVTEAIVARPELVHQLEMVICSTSSVNQVCPSIAAQVLAHIQRTHPDCHAQAFDILATCSGYLYGLQLACDFLQQRPGASVLLLTSEILSPLISPDDLGSTMSFGDAATATWCISDNTNPSAEPCLSVSRPMCFATGDPAKLLTVPPLGTNSCISMQGGAVRQLTVPVMAGALRQAVHQVGLDIAQLGRIIPHQTNQRIISDLARELNVSDDIMFKNLRFLGNTSSSTLPLAIREYILRNHEPGQHIGFVTFGGGFTYAAATARLL